MEVKVKWRNKNPFVPIERMGIVSTGEVADDTTIEVIEDYAKEATPEWCFLFEIKLPDVIYRYSYTDGKREIVDAIPQN